MFVRAAQILTVLMETKVHLLYLSNKYSDENSNKNFRNVVFVVVNLHSTACKKNFLSQRFQILKMENILCFSIELLKKHYFKFMRMRNIVGM